LEVEITAAGEDSFQENPAFFILQGNDYRVEGSNTRKIMRVKITGSTFQTLLRFTLSTGLLQ
jgi:hypothetical protein